MDKNTMIKLPFWETIKRSFMFSVLNLETFVKVSALWLLILVYEILTGFPSLCSISNSCQGGVVEVTSSILTALAGIGITVAFCRNIILKEEVKGLKIAFGKRELKTLGWGILFALLIIVPSVVIIGVLAAIFKVLPLPNILFVILAIAVPFTVAILLSGLSLVFPAIAVDNNDIRFKQAFKITEGNGNRIFWGQVFVMLPFLLLVIIISFMFGLTGINTFITKLIFAFMLLLFSFFGSFLRASFYAHMYQYFMHHNAKGKK